MGRVALENGTLVEWDIDDKMGEVILSGEDGGGEPLWLCTLPCYEPRFRDYLMARVLQRPLPIRGGFLMVTDGEHPRGATSEEAAVHFVDEEGNLRWSHAMNCPKIAVDGERLIVIGEFGRQGPGLKIIARELNLPGGKLRSERSFEVPEAPRPTSLVAIEKREGGYAVTVASTAGTRSFPL